MILETEKQENSCIRKTEQSYRNLLSVFVVKFHKFSFIILLPIFFGSKQTFVQPLLKIWQHYVKPLSINERFLFCNIRLGHLRSSWLDLKKNFNKLS